MPSAARARCRARPESTTGFARKRQARKTDSVAAALATAPRGQCAFFGERDGAKRRVDLLRRCGGTRKRDEGRKILRRRQLVFQRGRVTDERDGGAKARIERRGDRSLPAESPAAGAVSPASMRSSVVLPLPLAPVTINACPGSTRKLMPANNRA